MSSDIKNLRKWWDTRVPCFWHFLQIWVDQCDPLCLSSTHTNFHFNWTSFEHSYSSNLTLKPAEIGIALRNICPFPASETSLESGEQAQHSHTVKIQKNGTFMGHACPINFAQNWHFAAWLDCPCCIQSKYVFRSEIELINLQIHQI